MKFSAEKYLNVFEEELKMYICTQMKLATSNKNNISFCIADSNFLCEITSEYKHYSNDLERICLFLHFVYQNIQQMAH